MTKQPETTSQDAPLDPRKMSEIVRRLKQEGRLPSPEQVNEVLQKYRSNYQAQVRRVRQEGKKKK